MENSEAFERHHLFIYVIKWLPLATLVALLAGSASAFFCLRLNGRLPQGLRIGN